MLRAALRDLQWRWKRFVIAMVGVALVFAMGLIMTGLSESFSLEVDRTLRAIDADAWAVSEDASGPFTSFVPMLASAGGPDASPVMVLRQTIADGGTLADIIVVGVEPGRLGSPQAARRCRPRWFGRSGRRRRARRSPASGTPSRWAARRSGWSARCRVSASTPVCRWCTSP